MWRGDPNLIAVFWSGCCLACGATAHAGAAPCGWEIEAVIGGPGCGPLIPFSPMIPQAIRDRVAVGWYSTCVLGPDEAWVWSESQGLTVLDRPPGSDGAGATALEGDVVVGWYSNDGIYPQAALWNDGAMLALGTGPGGNWSEPSAISNGVIVGTWGNNLVGGLFEGFRWQAGEFEDLSPLIGGTSSSAEDIDASGAIVGWRRPAPREPRIAFLLEGEELTLLGPLPGGFSSQALAINDARQVVGFGNRPDESTGQTVSRAFVWRDGVMKELGHLTGFKNSGALDVSDAGLIVGTASSPGGRAVIWINDAIFPLDELVVDRDGLELTSAWSIDDDGRILAAGTPDAVAVVLAPVESLPADLTCDGEVDADDFEALLGSWGPCPKTGPCPGDLDGDGAVGIVDFLALLAGWT